jgi:hypothetical protein
MKMTIYEKKSGKKKKKDRKKNNDKITQILTRY